MIKYDAMPPAPTSQTRTTDSPPAPDGGVVIAGYVDKATFEKTIRLIPVSRDGFKPFIYLLAPHHTATLQHNLSGFDKGIKVFAGSNCTGELLAYLTEHLVFTLPKQVIAASRDYLPLAQQFAPVLTSILQEQAKQADDMRSALAKLWSQRGLGYWHKRYSADKQRQRPLRILIATSRFSTFMRYAADDLGGVFEGQGHTVRQLREPHDHTYMTELHCLMAMDQFDPDLVVLLNYTQAMLTERFPAGWPYVCWVQDGMGHFFQASPSKPTELDFIAGHCYEKAVALEGYGADSLFPFLVPVSVSKFEPTDDGLMDRNGAAEFGEDRFACDIAYVSHQSGTPEVLYEQLIQPFDKSTWSVFHRCKAEIEAVAAAWQDGCQYHELERLKKTLTEALGQSRKPGADDQLLNQFILPLADRMLRNQMAHWAAEIAKTHGLRFHLYGKGWDQHPTLGEFARGEVEHGDDLRLCYQNARVHLHASVHGAGHQRIFECAVSGGLPLARRSWTESALEDWHQLLGFYLEGRPPDTYIGPEKTPVYEVAKHDVLTRLFSKQNAYSHMPVSWNAEKGRQVLADINELVPNKGPGHPIYCGIATDHGRSLPPAIMRPLHLLERTSDLTFSTQAELEAAILKAIQNPDWRDRESRALAARVKETVSMDRFAQSMIEMVTRKLGRDPEVSGSTRERP